MYGSQVWLDLQPSKSYNFHRSECQTCWLQPVTLLAYSLSFVLTGKHHTHTHTLSFSASNTCTFYVYLATYILHSITSIIIVQATLCHGVSHTRYTSLSTSIPAPYQLATSVDLHTHTSLSPLIPRTQLCTSFSPPHTAPPTERVCPRGGP